MRKLRGPTRERETLTVGELKAMLRRFPDETPILVSADGHLRAVGEDFPYIHVPTVIQPRIECLIFDVDESAL